jgi:hypothetical protein
LRKEETSAMVASDEKLDRRELRDPPKTVMARARGRIDNQNGLPRAGEEFLFEICHNPLKSPDSKK